MNSAVNRRMSPHAGVAMKGMVKSHLGPTSEGSSSPIPSTLSPRESARNWSITSWLNQKNFMGNIKTHVIMAGDKPGSYEARRDEFFRQSAMPWGDHFMHTETDAQRMNNISQQSAVKQRQLSPPSTYGQFYAFMHALAAQFGNLSSGQ